MKHIVLIKKVIDHIEDHLRVDLTIRQLAKAFHMSPYYFQRVFYAVTGFTVNKYIRNRRLTEAANELKSTSKSILEIAVDFEYGSQEAFSRAFQSQYGLTPLKYRKYHLPISLCHKLVVKDSVSEVLDIQHSIMLLDEQYVFGYAYKANQEYFKDIPNFYNEFGSRRRYNDILKRTNPAYAYGIVCDDENFTFVIGEKTDNLTQVKKGYRHIKLAKGHYAVFDITGSIKQLQNTWRYIYGEWFDESEYVRDEGEDFEVIDVNRSKYPNEMKASIYIPIRKAKQ